MALRHRRALSELSRSYERRWRARYLFKEMGGYLPLFFFFHDCLSLVNAMASLMAWVRPGESGILASERICVQVGRWGFGWGCEPWARAGIDSMILYISGKRTHVLRV